MFFLKKQILQPVLSSEFGESTTTASSLCINGFQYLFALSAWVSCP